jgi:hypothetical protein
VRIDGTGLGPYDGIAGLVAIDSRGYIAVEGLEIAHFHDLADTFVPAGVFVTGTAHHIALRGLEVHDIRTATADAHGIAVYGTSGDAAIHDVTIDRNSVHDNHLGSSESMVVNGNVRDWSITHNHIFRNDNIGIDAIGFEGKAPRNGQARDGYIADNVVTDIDSLGNPAYDEDEGTNCRCADGIYVDAGRGLLIERNMVLRTNIALEIASEHSFGSASDVLARDTCWPTAPRSASPWAATTPSVGRRSTHASSTTPSSTTTRWAPAPARSCSSTAPTTRRSSTTWSWPTPSRS